MNNILKTDAVTMKFGGLTAVDNVDLELKEGTIHALIGPNGAGKTTFFNIVSGIYIPTDGIVLLNNENITKMKTHDITKKGIARTFQNILLFDKLTSLENVMVGRHINTHYSILGSVFKTKKMKNEEELCIKESMDLLEYVGLGDYTFTNASSLPYGKKRILEIARALASKPKILMLDEPCAGMNDTEKNELKETIFKIRDSGVTILLVEHDMRFVMSVSEKVTVLDRGKKIFEGLPSDVVKDENVIKAYLGKGNNYEENTGN